MGDVGRPSRYDPDTHPELAYRLSAILGATDAEMADFMDISLATLKNWKNQHPAFLAAIKTGKMGADAEVAERLRQRALGFEWDEDIPIKVKEVIYSDGKRVKEIETVVVKTVHKVVPPDTTAGIFWLKNRRPNEWRDKIEFERTDPSKLTDEELDKRRKALLKAV